MAAKTTPGSAGAPIRVHLGSHVDERVSSAYLLASAALSSFYGKISDLVGRKAVLYPVIVVFLVRGLAVCAGGAQR